MSEVCAAPADRPMLIIGAGQAGAMAASALRSQGYTGALILLGQEDCAPYERPPLSKAVLLDAAQDAASPIHQQAYYTEQGIELRLGVHVTRLEPERHCAWLSDGTVVHYAKCLLATGGRARELPGLAAGTNPRLHYIRTLQDAQALRAHLQLLQAQEPGGRAELVVLGGGFLGLEVASSALQMGLQPIVLEPAQALLARATPLQFSQWLQALVQAHGVDLRLGVGSHAIETQPQGLQLTLSNGQALLAHTVVAAIGQIANTELAAEAGLAVCPVTGGIRIDEQCQTSADDVFAAGDCTSQVQPSLGKLVRLESWQSANEQARLAAAAMLGLPAGVAASPWFWSDMFGLNLQMMGLPQPGLDYVVRGEMPQPSGPQASAAKFLIFGLDASQRLVYALAVNAGGDLRALRALFASDTQCDAHSLCDSTRSLRDIVKSLQASAMH